MSLPNSTLPISYIVLDLEATSAIPNVARITEIALLRVEAGAAVAQWSTLVNPGVAIQPEAAAVSGVSDAMVADAPVFSAVVPEFCMFLIDGDELPIVAHNGARYDKILLEAELARIGVELPMTLTWVDTLPIARKLLPAKPSHTLSAIAAALDAIIPGQTWHRAMADCMTLSRCVEAMRDLSPVAAPVAIVPVGGAIGPVAGAQAMLIERVNAVQPYLIMARAMTSCTDDDVEVAVLEAVDAFKREIRTLEKLRTECTSAVKPLVLQIEREFRDNGIKPLEREIDRLMAVRQPFADKRAQDAADARAKAEREAGEIAEAQLNADMARLAADAAIEVELALSGDVAGAMAAAGQNAAKVDAVNDAAQQVYDAGVAAAAEIVPLPIRTSAAVVRDRIGWKIEIVSPELVERRFCSPDPDKIRAVLDVTNGATVIKGVTFEAIALTSSRTTRG